MNEGDGQEAEVLLLLVRNWDKDKSRLDRQKLNLGKAQNSVHTMENVCPEVMGVFCSHSTYAKMVRL